jgi:hypothetical protein
MPTARHRPGQAPVPSADALPRTVTERPLLDRLVSIEKFLATRDMPAKADLIAEAADLIQQQSSHIAALEFVLSHYEGEALQDLKPAAQPSGPLLPVEAPRNSQPIAWEDNPPPDSRSPLEVVVSQQTAMRCLVRHYGWVHLNAGHLIRPRRPQVEQISPWPPVEEVTATDNGHPSPVTATPDEAPPAAAAG